MLKKESFTTIQEKESKTTAYLQNGWSVREEHLSGTSGYIVFASQNEPNIPNKTEELSQVGSSTTLNALKQMTPAEARDYVEANVTDLNTAKRVLSRMAMVISYILRNKL